MTKKVGGVKPKRTGRSGTGQWGNTPAAPDVPDVPVRKVGGVKPEARGYGAVMSSQVQSCPTNCPGEYVQGMWIHSKTCHWASVLWKHHGKTEQDWQCPFTCEPITLSMGWTHPFDCPFWDETGRTPFDYTKPPRVIQQVEENDDLPF